MQPLLLKLRVKALGRLRYLSPIYSAFLAQSQLLSASCGKPNILREGRPLPQSGGRYLQAQLVNRPSRRNC